MFKLGKASYRLQLPGETFYFEDALGHRWRLSTLQFQQWDVSHLSNCLSDSFCRQSVQVFYGYFLDKFEHRPGLDRVSAMQFQILNACSGRIIDKKTWQAVIQPNFSVAMAMVLNGAALDQCPVCHILLKSTERPCSMDWFVLIPSLRSV